MIMNNLIVGILIFLIMILGCYLFLYLLLLSLLKIMPSLINIFEWLNERFLPILCFIFYIYYTDTVMYRYCLKKINNFKKIANKYQEVIKQPKNK
jgi:hypothetical protein